LSAEEVSKLAAQLSGAMIRAGISAQAGDPRLLALASQGVSVETVLGACREARTAKPDEAIKPGYVFAILERWAKDAAALASGGATQPRASPRQAANANMQRLNDRLNGLNRHEPDNRIVDINERPA
jgi:hypothetical protein